MLNLPKKKGTEDKKYRYHKCIIAFDQSYTRTGVAVAVDGELVFISSIKLKKLKNKTEKRKTVRKGAQQILDHYLKKYDKEDICVFVERIRTFTHTNDFRPAYLKSIGALTCVIVDEAIDRGIKAYSVDTRAWKSKVLGTCKPSLEPIEGVKNPQKFASVRKIIELGHEKDLRLTNGVGGFLSYDDDAADAACIALYGFCGTINVLGES